MTDRETLLAQIEKFLDENEMAGPTFGRKAVNDGKLLKRLRSGAQIQLKTAEKIMAFMNNFDRGRTVEGQ